MFSTSIHTPPTIPIKKFLGSNFNGNSVLGFNLNLKFAISEANPILACISPKRRPKRITKTNNVIADQLIKHTYTNSGPFSKRQESELMAFTSIFFSKSSRIEFFWIWIIFWIVVDPFRRYKHINIFFD